MTVCDECGEPVLFRVYAAYDVAGRDDGHPRVARYTAPIIRACGRHLVERIERDQGAFGHTAQYVIRVDRERVSQEGK